MAARPNTLRTLDYGKRIADNQCKRLGETIAMAEKVIAENKTLTPADIASYKACISAAKKQIAVFSKLAEFVLPEATEPVARKRGRPSKGELEKLSAARGDKKAVAPVTDISAAPKKRGRPPKAKDAAAVSAASTPDAAPKRRGRPPKVQSVPVAEVPVQQKRRGRPPKAKADAVAVPAAIVVKPVVDSDSGIDNQKKKPGRPKGSKNKVLNGKNAQIVTA